jgi:hypothetical protein
MVDCSFNIIHTHLSRTARSFFALSNVTCLVHTMVTQLVKMFFAFSEHECSKQPAAGPFN